MCFQKQNWLTVVYPNYLADPTIAVVPIAVALRWADVAVVAVVNAKEVPIEQVTVNATTNKF